MGHVRSIQRASIGVVTAFVVTLAACGPPFPTSPAPAPSPVSSTTTTPSTTTVVVPPTVLPATQSLDCPGASVAAASSGTVAMVVDDPLDGAELFAATIEAANDAVAESDEVSPVAENGEPVVSITSVVDGTPVIDTVALSESLGAAADASLLGDVVAVEAVSTVSITQDTDGTSGVLASNDPLRGHLWAFDALDFERLWQCGTGKGVTVAVVDTGVLGSHPDLIARVTPGWTKLTTAAGTVGGADVDPDGHGTHVAGTIGAVAGNGIGIAGVAPDVKIVPVRVLGGEGNGTNSNVAAGITWAVGQGVDVINLSLGSFNQSSAVETALAHAVANGVTVIAAAGNGGEDSPTVYPAAFDETIAVASITSSLVVAANSSRGDYVDVAAPGSGIVSTYIESGYASSSGTSMAAPHVSGLVALLLAAQPNLTEAELRTRLISSVDDAGVPGFDPAYGWGIINPVRALTGGS